MSVSSRVPSLPRPSPWGRGGKGAQTSAWADLLFKVLCQAAALLVIGLAAALVVVLVWHSWESIRTYGARFFVQAEWDPVHKVFGALAFVYGTLVTSFIAMFIAVPLGIATAAFLSEIAPDWVRRPASFLVEMLAAIPSIVYGFWGAMVMAPKLQVIITWLGGPNTSGSGLLPAGLVLAIMIVPYVAAVTYDSHRAVPMSQRAAALALGATRWQMIWRVVIPYARPGIIGGCFLALGRALGETMAVTMLIGNNPQISLSPLAMGDSIASVLANQLREAPGDLEWSALVELGLVLLAVNVVVNMLARVLIRRVHPTGRSSRVMAGPQSPQREALQPVSRQSDPSPVIAVRERYAKTASGHDAHFGLGKLPRTVLRAWSRRARHGDLFMTGMLGLALVITLVPLFLILGHLVFRGITGLSWEFFTSLSAPVGIKGGGIANSLPGSILLVTLATLFAVPVGMFAAIYLAEYRSDRLGPAVRLIGELLGGVPSVVIGVFAYAMIVRPMHAFSGWAGAFALGVLMIPTVMRASEEALKMVPMSLRDAGYALGASQWHIVTRVVVPAALPAVITGVFLGIARIGGETAPLLFTAFGNNWWPRSPGDPMPSLPIFIWEHYKSPNYEGRAWAASLILVAIVMLLNFGIRLVTSRRQVSVSQAD